MYANELNKVTKPTEYKEYLEVCLHSVLFVGKFISNKDD